MLMVSYELKACSIKPVSHITATVDRIARLLAVKWKSKRQVESVVADG